MLLLYQQKLGKKSEIDEFTSCNSELPRILFRIVFSKHSLHSNYNQITIQSIYIESLKFLSGLGMEFSAWQTENEQKSQTKPRELYGAHCTSSIKRWMSLKSAFY